MKNFIFMLILFVVLIWEKWRRPKVCEKKINEYIKKIGGEMISVEKVSIRDEIFKVHYKIEEAIQVSVVKFNLFYHMDWK